MSRIMVVGAGAGAVLLARMMMQESLILLGKPAEVIVVDDSLPPAVGNAEMPAVMSRKDADVLILGCGSHDTFGGVGMAVKALQFTCAEVYLPTEHSYVDIKQARQQVRHQPDRKQQSMQAKARRR